MIDKAGTASSVDTRSSLRWGKKVISERGGRCGELLG